MAGENNGHETSGAGPRRETFRDLMERVAGPGWRQMPLVEGADRVDAAGHATLAAGFRRFQAHWEEFLTFLQTNEGIPLRAIRASRNDATKEELKDIDAAVKYCRPHCNLMRLAQRELSRDDYRSLLVEAVSTSVLVDLVESGKVVRRRTAILDLALREDPKVYRDTLRRSFRKLISKALRERRMKLTFDGDPPELSDSSPLPIDAIHAAETARRLRAKIERLGARGFAALDYYLGLGSRRELAKRHGVTVEAVRHAEAAVEQAVASMRRAVA